MRHLRHCLSTDTEEKWAVPQGNVYHQQSLHEAAPTVRPGNGREPAPLGAGRPVNESHTYLLGYTLHKLKWDLFMGCHQLKKKHFRNC